jgi:hypothetical protein
MAPMMRSQIPMGSGFNFSSPPFPPTMGGFNFNQSVEQNAPVLTMI